MCTYTMDGLIKNKDYKKDLDYRQLRYVAGETNGFSTPIEATNGSLHTILICDKATATALALSII